MSISAGFGGRGLEFARRNPRQCGVTLIELIVFIIIVSVGVVGVLSTMRPMLRDSANPMIRKQMAAVAESMLLEVLSQPFTYCDPDDVNASSANSTADCTGAAAASQDKGGNPLTSSTPAGESRLLAPLFDNVADYGGYSQTPVTDITGSANALPAGYTVAIAVIRAGATFGLAPADALQVVVTVSFGSESLALSSYRFRYAPRY
jgi:MSHA pilin protein MshD